jgi:7-carboxy-7-deazaguanine synthase
MFGSNEIAGQKAFANAPLNSLLVTSIFFTLQGEGPLAGRCAVFVRLAKCNLACKFCDTFFDKGEWLTFEEIEQRARAAIRQTRTTELDPVCFEGDVVLVVTGGEPTLQPNLTGFLLGQAGKWAEIQVESNGLIERLLPLGTILVVSPKCTEPEKGTRKGHYLRPRPAVLQRADCLKFVVDAHPMSSYYRPPEWADMWRQALDRPVYISPMNHYQEGKPLRLLKAREMEAGDLAGRTLNETVSFWEPGLLDRGKNQENHEHAARLCLQHGYRLSLQTHLYASLP